MSEKKLVLKVSCRSHFSAQPTASGRIAGTGVVPAHSEESWDVGDAWTSVQP